MVAIVIGLIGAALVVKHVYCQSDLDFISKEMGNLYYNQGLYDAQTVLTDQMDSLNDAIYQLEQ
ncbi:MAG: hypothetical protein ACJASL_001338 [Paraglaciecola sp.]